MQQPALMHFLSRLGSLRLTLVALLLLGGGIVYAYATGRHTTLALVPPLALLALNLIGAVATHPAFRCWNGLLIFHLGLIALVLLVAAGRLTYLKGQIELTEGEEFSGELIETDAGPLHHSALADVRFINEGFGIAYSPGLKRDRTLNRVRYLDGDGKEQVAEIGDQTPLVLKGYRFYTTSNKGFAPTFLWHPAGGMPPMLGAVHLPSYPMNEYRQARGWQLPGTGIKIWTMLQFDEIILDPSKTSEFRLPNKHKVIVRIGDQRHELLPGQAIELPEGRLVYDGLRTWMGYSVFYDRTIHWLLVVCMVSVMALGWHFWRKFTAKPWNT